MSGILEQILAQNTQILALLQGGVQPAPVQQPQYVQQPVQQPAYVQQPVQQPVQQMTQTPANLTADQITALIQPHIGNEAIKGELGNAMRAMGINALPETQPHQYAELYSRFQAVIQRFTGAGGNPAAVQQQAPASII